ncbi:DSD1 family PLP-dependent enzyme [Comamonas testosteroni]|uniref:DSD1 family PLP-dependent enzyme n=1 Tax=Comamonas testosteroni TaxID=285 RepID=A0A373FR37_COMTE|nr:DSD1 family PLP-dependent enzyme [Comamonas testosteroni]RGE45819.1 DSD1 family PLP-dependent enzyme [Comamonas testosteroni]
MKHIPEHLQALVGQAVKRIDTPALVIDLDAMDRNIERMARFAQQHGVLWRAHAKLHKSAHIAHLLEHAGAVGHCVQKLSEAEALAAGGITNIFISNEVIAPTKLARVAALAQSLNAQGGRLAIAVDSEEGITRLAKAMQDAKAGPAAIDVLVEINVGQNRCGVEPGVAALALANAIQSHPSLRFAGLQAYHGGAQHLRTAAERKAAIEQVLKLVNRTRHEFDRAGIEIPLITGAGTGTMVNEAASGIYGEIQPGSFLFMDADYAANQRDAAQPMFEHALFVKTQVMSRNDRHAVCDAGHKAHAIDSGLPKLHALPPENALRFANGGDEHGVLHPDAEAGNTSGWLPALGDTLWLIPGHCDPTVNLHDFMIGVRGGRLKGVVERIFSVDGRGALT